MRGADVKLHRTQEIVLDRCLPIVFASAADLLVLSYQERHTGVCVRDVSELSHIRRDTHSYIVHNSLLFLL